MASTPDVKYRVFVSPDDKQICSDDEVPYVIGQTLGYATQVTTRRVQKILSSRFQKHGILFAEWPILLNLWAKETATQRELSKLISIAEANIARTVVRMEKKKLLTRKRNAQDRRESIVQLTDKGKALQNVLLKEVVTLSDTMKAALGEERMAQVFNAHIVLNQALEKLEHEEMRPDAKPL